MIFQSMITAIIEKLQETVNPYWIIVFGSTAENREREDSDIDIAYLSDTTLGNYERFLLAQELANIVHRDVDLVDLSEASTVFQAQIIHTGKTIFCSDEKRKVIFEMKTLKMYSKLNEERQIVFDDKKKRGSILKNEVILNKISTIERCKKRIQDVYGNNPENLEDFTKQDSNIILNIQRACEASIDLAMHIVQGKKIRLPQSSREAFDLLVTAGLLSVDLANKLKAMVGFRNIAVHDYQSVNLDIVRQIIEKHLTDFKLFTKEVMGILEF
jgi:uncharacterized protein YutE (UPF0331/DUF86 family)/predicted nucleotidyltransferase